MKSYRALQPILSALANLCLFSIAAACISAPAVAQTSSSSASSQDRKPVATVAGDPIYEDQFSPTVDLQLQMLHQNEYKLKKQAIEAIMSQRVLETEAKKRNTTVEKLLQTEVDSKVPDPTPDEVEAYYKDHQSQIGKSFDEVKLMLAPALKGMKVQRARQLYAQNLLAQAEASSEAVLLLRPPSVNVAVDPLRVRGDANAPVTIVEFSDFGCPYCRKAEPILAEVLAKYPGKVKLAYRDYPLPSLHPNAEIAAEASRCAADQGKFWELHDLLFANPDKLDQKNLLADAQTLHLDEKRFDACLASGQYKTQVQQDLQDGIRAGVRGTPGFFVNGVFVEGAQSPETFDKLIKQDLAQSTSSTSGN